MRVPRNNHKIELLITNPGENLWCKTLETISKVASNEILNLPVWILPDTRHQKAAQIDLMRALGRHALTTGNVHTLLSFAGALLHIPIYDVLLRPTFASIRLRDILDRECPQDYIKSSKSPGFIESLWTALEESESRGHFPGGSLDLTEGKQPPPSLRLLQQNLHDSCASFGKYTAGEILWRAIQQLNDEVFSLPASTTIFVGPFHNPTRLEISFIRALTVKVGKCILVVPPQATWIHESGLMDPLPTRNEAVVSSLALMRPKSPEDEYDAAFSFIAENVLKNEIQYYRDVRLIVPFLLNNLPRLEASAHRYHVPVKVTIPQPLISFPGVQLLLKLLDLFTRQWEHRDLLEVLRSRIIDCPVEETSIMIRKVLASGHLKNQPAGERWIEIARDLGLECLTGTLEVLHQLDSASYGEITVEAFIDFVTACTNMIKANLEPDEKTEWGLHHAEAWKSFENLLKDMGLSRKRVSRRSHFINLLRSSIKVCNYVPGIDDADAVEIISNNQGDHLPARVVIHIGLNSRIPSTSRPNPFTEEAGKRSYREEYHRFRLHLGNAKDRILLSCPRYDDEGDELSLSPFLRSLENDLGESLPLVEFDRWHPRTVSDGSVKPFDPKVKKVSRKKSLSIIKDLNQHWNPTRLDDAIQCPFLHFARHILGLSECVDRTVEGVTAPLFGSIAHGALELYLRKVMTKQPLDIETWTRTEFRKRTGAFDPHLDLIKGLEDLVYSLNEFIERGGAGMIPGFLPGSLEFRFKQGKTPSSLKMDFSTGKVHLEGRIDRIDFAGERDCVIFDYKYSKLDSQKSVKFFDDLEGGLKPQLPLYALLVSEILKKRPVAFFEMHLRSQALLGIRLPSAPAPAVAFLPDSKIEEVDIELFNAYLTKAISKLEEMAVKIASGTIHPQPRDADRCGPGKCEYADLCRYRQRWRRLLA